MAQAYRDVGFQALFDQPKVASLDDVLILNDNFDTPIHIDPRFRDNFKDMPNKMVSTITILVCMDGLNWKGVIHDWRTQKYKQ